MATVSNRIEPTSSPINTVEELQKYLQIALQLEHATIPPYLTALYSIKLSPDKSNLDSYNIIRAVLVEEMLHLTLAANLLNAIGGAPNLTAPGFVPDYPAYLPTGETDFQVGIQSFSADAITTFLNIERPTPRAAGDVIEVEGVAYLAHHSLEAGRKTGRGLLPRFHVKNERGETLVLHYYSIGEFYKAIGAGFKRVAHRIGEKALFKGDRNRQVSPQYYYSAGGAIFEVTDLETALEAVDLIAGQGEGFSGRIYDDDGELSHYYRFDQIRQGRYYRVATDEPGKPTGETFEVYWDETYSIRPNLKVASLPAGSEVRDAAVHFNDQYRGLLQRIHSALNGRPAELVPAFADMFRIRDAAMRLIHNPLPSGDANASPTFEIA